MQRLSVLRQNHWDSWSKLQSQPFLRLLRQGKVPSDALRRWMTQDFYFLEGLVRFQALLLQRAPRPDRMVLAQAIVMSVEDLDWLSAQDLDLSQPRHNTTEAYLEFLGGLAARSYELGSVLHWVLRRSFLDAWLTLKTENDLLFELSQRWSAPEFKALEHDIAGLADCYIEKVPPEELAPAVEGIVAHELAFWKMAEEFLNREQS